MIPNIINLMRVGTIIKNTENLRYYLVLPVPDKKDAKAYLNSITESAHYYLSPTNTKETTRIVSGETIKSGKFEYVNDILHPNLISLLGIGEFHEEWMQFKHAKLISSREVPIKQQDFISRIENLITKYNTPGILNEWMVCRAQQLIWNIPLKKIDMEQLNMIHTEINKK